MATRPEQYQRSRLDEWTFGFTGQRLLDSELTVVLALAPHMDSETLEAWPGLLRMAGHAGCDVKKIKRGLDGLIRRGRLTKEEVGGGAGNLTLYRGVIPSKKTGAEHDSGKLPSNSVKTAVLSGCDGNVSAPVSEKSSFKDSLPRARETGSKTGSKTGSAPRAPASRKGKVELSTLRFAQSGPIGGALGPGTEEKLRDFTWRMAKAFPAKRGGVPQASADLKSFLEAGRATREEIEAGIRAWMAYFEACFAANRHHTGTTMAGWLEAEHFRFDPRDVYDWTPEEESREFLS